MKRFFYIFLSGSIVFLFIAACGKDNYDAPSSTLTGKVVHNGKSLGVRGSNGSVKLQLWQDGFELKTPIDVYVAQDGSFSATLFDGAYKLAPVPGNGPWQDGADTVYVDVSGNTETLFEVEPYYTLENISYDEIETEVRASFNIGIINDSRAIESVSLLVGNTTFVDLGHSVAKTEITDGFSGNLTIVLDKEMLGNTSQKLFARLALKIEGITEAVYDPNIHPIN